jgi:hypothetical protein
MLINLSDTEELRDLPAGILLLVNSAADISTAGLYSIAVEYL